MSYLGLAGQRLDMGHETHSRNQLHEEFCGPDLGHAWATDGPQMGHGKYTGLPLTFGHFEAKIRLDYRTPLETIDHVGAACAVFPLMVRLAGIEPTTLGFGGQYSIH